MTVIEDTEDERGGKGVTVPAETDQLYTFKLYAVLTITNKERLEISVSTAGIATMGAIEDAMKAHMEDPNAHPALAGGTVEAHNEDPEAHPSLTARMQAAQSTAASAQSAAEAAMEKANAAEDAAASAGTVAAAAMEKAADNKTTITQVGQTADTALSTANSAKTMAAQAAQTAAAAQQAANDVSRALTDLNSTINTVPSQAGALYYTGGEQTPSLNGYDSTKMTLSVTAKTDAGTYEGTVTPKSGFKWADGTTAAKTFTWKITPATVEVPTVSQNPTYTGSAISPTFSGYETSKMTLNSGGSGTNAGNYAAKFQTKPNYQWPDGSTGEKSVPWNVVKAAGSLSLNKTSMSLNVSALTGAIAVTRAGDGAITATSSNTNIATVSVSGATVTVTAKKTGSATITVRVAAGANHTAPANKTCAVTVTVPSTSLNDNTWATIKGVSDAGQGENYWSVGDTKRITINGQVGNSTFSNLAIDAFIIGFNHNSSREGANRIHFQIGKISGKDVCLCDSKYGTGQSSNGLFHINQSNNNIGGWKDSYMRKTLLGNSNTPTSPLAGSLMAALPSDLRAVMKPVTKYSDNTGGGADNASYVTSTTDYLFLLAAFEYHGIKAGANSAEKNYQLQYDYYKAGNSKVKYKHGETGTAAKHWCRSIFTQYGNNDMFCTVNEIGTESHGSAPNSLGVAPGFAV